MSLMDWDETLNVGVEEMNYQHKGLLNLMNQLFDMYEQEKFGSEVIDTIMKLGEATTQHFAEEEEYMKKIDFPELKIHSMIHERLLKQYSEFSKEIQKSGGRLNKQFFDFLQLWLGAHIRGIDVKYGNHAKSRGMKSAV